jgi:hypothetical protein
VTTNRLLEFNSVIVYIPNKFLLRCLRKEYITMKEKAKIREKFKEIEKNLYRLEHAKSVVAVLKDKHFDER